MTNSHESSSGLGKPDRPGLETSLDPTELRWLIAHPGIFFWRQGHWLLRHDKDGKVRKLAASRVTFFKKLLEAGQLVEPTPGFFRLVAAPPKPLLNEMESPLARIASLRSPDGKPFVDLHEIAAGERLRRDFEKSSLAARTTSQYDAAPVSGGGHWQMSDNALARLTDNAIDARQRLHLALDAVGPELSSILYHVCCLAGGLEQAELRLDLPRRTGKIVLALALTRLARHYGFKPPLKHGSQGKIGHWAVDDFKPTIAPPSHQP